MGYYVPDVFERSYWQQVIDLSTLYVDILIFTT